MEKTSVTFKKLDTTILNQKIRFQISYAKGGHNYFIGKNEVRGYYLSVQSYEDRGDGLKTIVAFSGVKELFFAAKRYSDSKFTKLFNSLKDDDFKKLLDHVLHKNNLKIADPD